MRRYSDDMDRMQQDAVRRMQEMQNRGKPVTNTEKPPAVQEKPVETVLPQENETQYNAQPQNNAISQRQSNQNFLDLLMHDKEKSIILILILLLSTESTDTGIILALIYLLI